MLITKMTLGSLGELIAFDQKDVTYVIENVKAKCPCKNYSKVGRTIDIISGIYSSYLTTVPGFEWAKSPDEQKSMVLSDAIRKICAEAPDYEDTEADRMWNNPPESCFENKAATNEDINEGSTANNNQNNYAIANSSTNKKSMAVELLSYIPVFAVGGALLTAIKNMRNKKSKKSIGRKRRKRRRK